MKLPDKIPGLKKGVPTPESMGVVPKGHIPKAHHPTPETVVAAGDHDVRAEIARVAEAHQADAEGYGDAAWDEATRTVLYVAGDWTDTDPIASDFLDIDGVDGFVYEMEGRPDGWCDAEVVYGGGGYLDCDAEADLAAVVAMAAEPLAVEPDPAVIMLEPPPLETPLTSSVPMTTERLLDVLGKFAERDHAPAPIFNLHFPQHLGVTFDQADVTVPVTVEPTPVHVDVQPTPVDVHVPEQAAPTVTVLAADPAPVHVDVHVPEQPAPAVEVTLPQQARATAVRVEFDGKGNKIYTPTYDEQEATT